MSNLEKDIVGAFLLRPELFNEIKLNGNLFIGPNCKTIFNYLKKAHVDKRKIDERLLIGEFDKKIKDCTRFIMSLTDGQYESITKTPIVNEKIRRLKEKKIGGELNEEAVQRGKDLMKDVPHDETRLFALCDELRNIQKSEKELEEENIPMTFRMSDIIEEAVPWLWRNYIPSESITLINGDPDSGKTWWALDLASRVTRGEVWPDGTKGNTPANVYYMTYEDTIAQQVKSRIRTLGADQARFFSFNSEHPLNLLLSGEEGRDRLEQELIRIDITNGLLITDPILDFTGSTNPNAVEFVRPLLTPLAKMAKRLHFAIVMIGHLNKDQMKSVMYRASGSTGGWQGKARAAFLIARQIEDKRLKRFVFPVKNNWAWPEPQPMEFEIRDSKLIFDLSEVDVDSVLNPPRGRPPIAKLKAKEILADMFKDRQEIPTSEVEERTEKMGISAATLTRVKKEESYGSDWRKNEDENKSDYWVWIKPLFKKDEK